MDLVNKIILGDCLEVMKEIPDESIDMILTDPPYLMHYIDFPKISSDKLVHPTEKPIGLLELFIQNNSDPGNVIFDGFAGSGTTAIAALNTGRSFICIEKDERYHRIANERVAKFLEGLGRNH